MLYPRHCRSLVSFCLLLTTLTAAVTLDCSDIRDDNQSWSLKALGGPHAVKSVDSHPPVEVETTFTIDICRPLKVPKKEIEEEYCPNGTRICGLQRIFNPIENSTEVYGAIPIAGDYGLSTGGALDPKVTRLKTSDSPSDRQKEGVRLLLHGPKYPPNSKSGKKQQAIIDFVCDRKEQDRRRDEDGEDGGDKKGEGDEDSNPKDDGRETDDEDGGTLKFLSYDDVQDVQVLSLEWTTKHACEGSSSGGSSASSGHWGFFTWFIIIGFLGTATYLIFGSWLNYTRHGIRGFDAVPHSEAIRDLPYLLRDWSRKIVNTVSGGGSRGGYSAV